MRCLIMKLHAALYRKLSEWTDLARIRLQRIDFIPSTGYLARKSSTVDRRVFVA